MKQNVVSRFMTADRGELAPVLRHRLARKVNALVNDKEIRKEK
jgi:hypothetical protein